MRLTLWLRSLLSLGVGVVIGALGMSWYSSPNRSGDTDPNAPGILAVVDGVAITETDFLREMKRRGGESNFATREARRGLLDDMIRLDVLSANARRAGYGDDLSVRQDIKYVLAGKFRQERLEPELAAVSVGDNEVERFYRQNEERFVVPAAVHAAILYFEYPVSASEDAREKVNARVSGVRAEAMKQPQGEHFGALAVRHSDDQASRYRGGDVGWLVDGQSDGRFDDAVVQAAFALAEPETLSQPVATPKGVYLVRVLDRREASVRPLEEVSDSIRQRLAASKRQLVTRQVYDTATASVSVRINEDRFAAMKLPDAAVADHVPRPPPVPQG